MSYTNLGWKLRENVVALRVDRFHRHPRHGLHSLHQRGERAIPVVGLPRILPRTAQLARYPDGRGTETILRRAVVVVYDTVVGVSRQAVS